MKHVRGFHSLVTASGGPASSFELPLDLRLSMPLVILPPLCHSSTTPIPTVNPKNSALQRGKLDPGVGEADSRASGLKKFGAAAS